MSRQTPSQNTAPQAPRTASWRLWFNFRRKRFWAALLVLVYTLGGFLLVPAIVKSVAISTVRDDLGREASIERVRCNPYVMSLEVNGFSMLDPDGAAVIEFDRFFANFQLSSLFRWAWTFREISLEGLDMRFERFASGDSRLSRLLADRAARAEPAVAEEQDAGGLPRLLLHNLALKGGRIEFRDDVPSDPVQLEFGPVDVSIQELNTLPDRDGKQTVSILLPQDASLTWQGSIDLAPLHSEGTLTLENSHLDQTIAYLKAVLPLESMQAVLSLRTDYRLSELPDGGVDVELDGLEARLENVAVSGLEPVTEFLVLPAVTATGGRLRYPENQFELASVRIETPRVVAWLNEEGQPSLQQLQPAGAGEPPAEGPDQAADGAGWRFDIGEFVLAGGQIDFEDRSIDPVAGIQLQNLELALRNISNEEGASFPLSLAGSLSAGGEFGFEGQLGVLPELEIRGAANAAGVPLTLAQPYAAQQVNILIGDGLLDVAADIALDPAGELTAGGNLAVAGLSIEDTRENQPLVGWERLTIDRFEAATNSSTLELSLVTFEQPFGRLVINEDLSTNLTGLSVAAEPPEPAGASPGETTAVDDGAPAAAASPEAVAEPFAVVIGGIRIREAALDFSDFSLPLPFATQIRQMSGSISTLDSRSATPADIRLEGQVDEYGLARIEGAMNLLDPVRSTDVTMEFRNLLMSNLSPYTVEFAGREIDEGKLDLDLNYRIMEGQLEGQNKVVMSDLVLGDEVDHPDAASLPLGLAVALLTDANGVIDIDLPVQGDVNDPEFAIGGVIWQAVVGLVTKIVTAPFRLLGNLIGVDSEDFGQFQFLGGRSDLTPPELEKIALLQDALQQRPELAIEVSGVFDPAIDVPALQFQRLRAAVVERLGPEYLDQAEEFRMLDEQIRSVLETLFIERNPTTALDTVKAAHVVPPADDPEGEAVLDELAYSTDLRDRLLAAEQIGPQELEQLANARAEAIRNAFIATGEIDEHRVVLAEPVATESEDDEWVVMELGVAAD